MQDLKNYIDGSVHSSLLSLISLLENYNGEQAVTEQINRLHEILLTNPISFVSSAILASYDPSLSIQRRSYASSLIYKPVALLSSKGELDIDFIRSILHYLTKFLPYQTIDDSYRFYHIFVYFYEYIATHDHTIFPLVSEPIILSLRTKVNVALSLKLLRRIAIYAAPQNIEIISRIVTEVCEIIREDPSDEHVSLAVVSLCRASLLTADRKRIHDAIFAKVSHTCNLLLLAHVFAALTHNVTEICPETLHNMIIFFLQQDLTETKEAYCFDVALSHLVISALELFYEDTSFSQSLLPYILKKILPIEIEVTQASLNDELETQNYLTAPSVGASFDYDHQTSYESTEDLGVVDDCDLLLPEDLSDSNIINTRSRSYSNALSQIVSADPSDSIRNHISSFIIDSLTSASDGNTLYALNYYITSIIDSDNTALYQAIAEKLLNVYLKDLPNILYCRLLETLEIIVDQLTSDNYPAIIRLFIRKIPSISSSTHLTLALYNISRMITADPSCIRALELTEVSDLLQSTINSPLCRLEALHLFQEIFDRLSDIIATETLPCAKHLSDYFLQLYSHMLYSTSESLIISRILSKMVSILTLEERTYLLNLLISTLAQNENTDCMPENLEDHICLLADLISVGTPFPSQLAELIYTFMNKYNVYLCSTCFGVFGEIALVKVADLSELYNQLLTDAVNELTGYSFSTNNIYFFIRALITSVPDLITKCPQLDQIMEITINDIQAGSANAEEISYFILTIVHLAPAQYLTSIDHTVIKYLIEQVTISVNETKEWSIKLSALLDILSYHAAHIFNVNSLVFPMVRLYRLVRKKDAELERKIREIVEQGDEMFVINWQRQIS